MRFTDFLKATVMLSMGAASVLALCTVLGAAREDDHQVVFISAGWWVVGALIGGWIGRRSEVSAQIGRLLAQARAATTMPEHRPTAVILNRLWPLLLAAAAAAEHPVQHASAEALACQADAHQQRSQQVTFHRTTSPFA